MLQLITSTYAPGEAFSADQLWDQAEVRAACVEADIATVKQFGKWLRQWCGAGLDRVTRNGDGIVWSVSADDLHEDAGAPADNRL